MTTQQTESTFNKTMRQEASNRNAAEQNKLLTSILSKLQNLEDKIDTVITPKKSTYKKKVVTEE